MKKKNDISICMRSGIIKKICILFSCVTALLLFFSMTPLVSLTTAAEPDTDYSWISADLAAGADMAKVIKKAVLAGMSVESAVAALVKAGADPSVVTYEAITANFSSTSVIKGVLNAVLSMNLSKTSFQATMTRVFFTAQMAGANRINIANAASDAGVSKTLIAQAVVNAEPNTSPTFGNNVSSGSITPSLEKFISITDAASWSSHESSQTHPVHP